MFNDLRTSEVGDPPLSTPTGSAPHLVFMRGEGNKPRLRNESNDANKNRKNKRQASKTRACLVGTSL